MKCFSKTASLISVLKKRKKSQSLTIVKVLANFPLGLNDARNGVH